MLDLQKFIKYTMGKKYFFITLITLIVSCSSDDITNKSNQNETETGLTEISKVLTNRKSDSDLSPLFLRLGVTSVTTSNNKLSAKTQKTFNFRGKHIDFSVFSVKIEKNFITLEQDDEFKIGILNKKSYLITTDYKGLLKKASAEILKQKEVFALIAYLNEITYNQDQRVSSKNSNSTMKSEGCNFFTEQGFSVGVGVNETSAKADLASSMEDDIASGATEGCTKIGEPEAVAWTNGTVWVQTWCCK